MNAGERVIGRGGTLALVVLALGSFGLASLMGEGKLPLSGEVDTAFAAVGSPCGGEPMAKPDQVIEGSFTAAQQGSYVMLPFRVPGGTDAIRVKYCHDQPGLNAVPAVSSLNGHTIDMGLYSPRVGHDRLWDTEEFRGWGGSSRKDVTLSPEAVIDQDPPTPATEKTTVGYRPGPVEPGRWAVELGVAAVGAELPGEDGQVDWRVEIDLIDDASFADQPYHPVPYRAKPASRRPGWYEGDMHVHARNSNPNDATMRESFNYAFCPDPDLGALCGEETSQPGAGLDFITLSDYVTDRSWGEIGSFQDDYPGKLIIRSTEVITYQGHLNNHASLRFVDYRTGPIYERELDGSLRLMRPAVPPARIFSRIQAAGGWTQINHPQTFPSEVPGFSNLCRGCSWEYTQAQTDYSRVDAIEVATGPGGLLSVSAPPELNPFTPATLQFYEDAIDAGGPNRNHIAAVGSSDSHKAGRPDNPVTQAPIGEATTVVRAPRLSEAGIRRGVKAGHTYVKVWGSDGPDLRLRAVAPGSADPATFGDTVHGASAQVTARVLNLDRARAARPGTYFLVVMHDGNIGPPIPIPADANEFSHTFVADRPGRYELRVYRLGVVALAVEAVATPVWLEPGG